MRRLIRQAVREVSRHALLAAFAGSALLAGASFVRADFDAQRQAVMVSPATQDEATIGALLKAGLAEHKPTQAIAVTQQWLSQNVVEDPMLLYYAAKAAELSGDWASAAALYRQYLTRADLKSEAASDAILGTYTLLINQLDNVESAYAFSKSEGNLLVANAQARQFDRWFLDNAKSRKDLEAVAARLLALAKAKVSSDLLIALYEDDFVWLLNAINDGRLDMGGYSPQFVETVKSLAKTGAVDRELCLLLDWSVSIKAYNMALLEGEQAEPPLAEARALLKDYPHHAKIVQLGWAGGNRSPHYRGDARKYWSIETEAKLQPINDAIKKLGPIELADYHLTLNPSYYSGRPQVLNQEEAREWVLANPKLANSKLGPVLSFNWHNMTLEDAKKLAPTLFQNPSPEAAGIRAVASVSQAEADELEKTVTQLLEKEAWRLSGNELASYIDRLWHRADRPGGNTQRDQLIARGKKLADAIKKSGVKKDDPAPKRMAAFRALWKDYLSETPKEIGVRDRLLAVLTITPEAIPEVLKDSRVEAQMIAREALAAGIVGSTEADKAYERYDHRQVRVDRYDPCIARVARTYRKSKITDLKGERQFAYVRHPLGEVIEQALVEQVKQKTAEPWLVLAWLNTQFPENNEVSVKLMADLMNLPGYKSMPYEVRRGARDWFKSVALAPAQFALVQAADVDKICKPLVELPEGADAAATAEALKKTLEGLRKSPVRHEILGLERVVSRDKDDMRLADPAVLEQVYELGGPMRSFQAESTFGAKLFEIVSKEKDPAVLHDLAAFLWRHTEVYHRTLSGMIELSSAMTEEHPSAAQALARCGLQTIARHKRGHTYYKKESDIPALRTIRGKAALAMGLIDIPVPKSDPAYGIYQSQAEFIIGNQESARELFSDNADQLMPVHRKLSVAYLLWVLQVTIENRDEAAQEELAKALMAWMQQVPSAFSLEQRVTLEIAYGDIAMQRSLLPEAQKIFARVSKNPDYASVFARHTATLRQVLVQRISGDYDGALQTLMELDSEKIPRLTTEAHYARAEVFYAMEEYQDSAEQISKVLERDPNHPDATILRGRVQLKLQKLIEATEVELGSVSAQSSIVPGELLKVTLNDPTLTVSSGGSDIEVEVWATSGDKEYLLLRQFGDQKTKYRGEVRTKLGKPNQDDGTLQIVGDDEIFYAYSERFRKKMVNLGENRGGPITVASDAVMMASARKLLSENEQRARDMQAATEILEKKTNLSIQNIDPERVAQLKADIAARERRAMLEARVKPGNPVYLRVIDPDRGRTAEVDKLAVSLSSSSGDLVGRVELEETGTHTGTFEGLIQTAKAQALAFGSSSEAGRNPNMVISPKDSYPAWRPIPGQSGEAVDHTFTVDLNDNAELGTLKIDASDQGYAIKRMLVQTAMHNEGWSTVATYPPSSMTVDKPWQPSITMAIEEGLRAPRGARSVYDDDSFKGLQSHLATGWLKVPDMALAKNVSGPTQMFDASIRTAKPWSWEGRDNNPAVVYKFQAYFYEPASVTRQFELNLGSHSYKPKNKKKADQPEILIAVNGRVITSKDGKKLAGQINLKPGIHKIEVWATGWVDSFGFGRTAKLRANLDNPDELVDCPETFFDPSTFPEGEIDHRNSAAAVEAVEGGKSFNVKFAEGSRARLIRLVFVEQEGPVPSLNKLSLTSPGGDRLLPVPEDYAEQRKNQLLEIMTGDRVTVRYIDDRFVTKGRQKHERFLNVAYTNGKVEFADIDDRMQRGSMRPYHETLLRFEYDKPLPVVIHDADMDVSVEPDKVDVTITSSSGNSIKLTAIETGPSTGTFRVFVTPVASSAKGKDQIQVPEGGKLTLTYRDAENILPGVPYDRMVSIDHAVFSTPRIEVGHATITDYEPEVLGDGTVGGHTQPLNERLVSWRYWQASPNAREDYSDRIKTRYLIQERMLSADEAPDDGLKLAHGRIALIDVLAPHMAVGEASSVKVYVQTDAGRKAMGLGSDAPFNLNVPGTLQVLGRLKHVDRRYIKFPERGGFVSRLTDPGFSVYERSQKIFTEGRFRLALPLLPGTIPERSYADPEEILEEKLQYPEGLVVKTGERIHIGVSYTDKQGKKQWSTTTAKVITAPILDVMEEGYRTSRGDAHVGEKLYVRVVDLAADKTSEQDTVRVYMASKAGQKHYFTLTETSPHSGVFKGVCQLSYSDDAEPADPETYDVARMGFPIAYGDALGVRYTDPSDFSTPVHFVKVKKGSDGTIAPFSKQYGDDETAMRTQFAMAEAFLELARRHRKLGQEKQAQHEFRRARQLLESAITKFNDPETRAHAQYLLGTLTMEDAAATEAGDLRDQRYQAALARFMKVTGSYPDTQYASRAQFQTAVIYERLNEPDIAAQEYVKLAYKHPESEHLATAMARLGTHFQRKAVTYEKQAAPLLKQTEDKDALYEGEVLNRLAKAEYIKAAQIFERLQERFPSDDLAGKAGLRAGQIYMRAEAYREAIKVLQRIIDNESYDGVEVRSQAMYWAGICQQTLRQQLLAYGLFKRITYDFPESKWAAYARSQLSTEQMLRLDQQLEIERLEEAQQQ